MTKTDMKNPADSNGAPDGGHSSLAHSSLLSWGIRSATSLRGFLPAHPGTALFIIERNTFDATVKLMGAFIPDDEERDVGYVSEAKAAAEAYLREWLLNVAAPLLANVANQPRP